MIMDRFRDLHRGRNATMRIWMSIYLARNMSAKFHLGEVYDATRTFQFAYEILVKSFTLSPSREHALKMYPVLEDHNLWIIFSFVRNYGSKMAKRNENEVHFERSGSILY